MSSITFRTAKGRLNERKSTKTWVKALQLASQKHTGQMTLNGVKHNRTWGGLATVTHTHKTYNNIKKTLRGVNCRMSSLNKDIKNHNLW